MLSRLEEREKHFNLVHCNLLQAKYNSGNYFRGKNLKDLSADLHRPTSLAPLLGDHPSSDIHVLLEIRSIVYSLSRYLSGDT